MIEEAKSKRARYTPGPWKVVHSVGEWIIRTAKTDSGLHGYVGGCPVGGAHHEFNALLMASAPDLVDALREAREALNRIAAAKFGVQGILEDHGWDEEKAMAELKAYYSGLVSDQTRTAQKALTKIDAALAKVGEGE